MWFRRDTGSQLAFSCNFSGIQNNDEPFFSRVKFLARNKTLKCDGHLPTLFYDILTAIQIQISLICIINGWNVINQERAGRRRVRPIPLIMYVNEGNVDFEWAAAEHDNHG